MDKWRVASLSERSILRACLSVAVILLCLQAAVNVDCASEEVSIHPLPEGRVLAHFRFTHDLNSQGRLPGTLRELLRRLPVRDVELALTRGRWLSREWGEAPTTALPPGAQLRATIRSPTQGCGTADAWTHLTHGLGGIFCVLAEPSSTTYPKYIFKPADAPVTQCSAPVQKEELQAGETCRDVKLEQQARPEAQLEDAASDGSTPRQQAASEKRCLLACSAQAQQHTVPGSTQLHKAGNCTRPAAGTMLYASLPREAVCTENLTPWLRLLPCQGKQGLAALVRDPKTVFSASYVSMTMHIRVPTAGGHEYMSATCSPPIARQQLHVVQTLTLVLCPKQQFYTVPSMAPSSGAAPAEAWTLLRLFNQPLPQPCKAVQTSWAKVQPVEQMGEHGPAAAAAAPAEPTQKEQHGSQKSNVDPEPCAATATCESAEASVCAREEGKMAVWDVSGAKLGACLEAVRWRQPPASRQPTLPAYEVHQYISGKGDEFGTLNLDIWSKRSATLAASELSVCVFQAVPWCLPVWLHTLQLAIDGKAVSLQDVVYAHQLQPSEDRGSSTTVELCMRLPANMSHAVLSVRFSKQLLTIFEYPPDAHRGVEIPAAIITITAGQHILDGQHGKQQQYHTHGALVPMPTPDFSMPYNVACMTCTVVTIYLGAVLGMLRRRGPDLLGVNGKSKRKQRTAAAMLLIACGCLAASQDRQVQRQLQAWWPPGLG